MTGPAWLPWALGSAGFAGLTAILAKVGVKDVDSDFATAIRTSVIFAFTWLVAFGRGVVVPIPGRTGLFLVLSGLATAASWLCYFHALKLGDASKVAPVDKLSVVVAVLLAAGFLHEKLSAGSIAGVVLIVLGSVLLARS